MIVNPYWTRRAAQQILSYDEPLSLNEVEEIIEEHCPFKRDVAYEEVGASTRKLDELLEMVRYMRGRL